MRLLPLVNVAGGPYDMRARWWSPQLGAFLTIDGYAYHEASATLLGWPGQNPAKWSDPFGRDGWLWGAAASAEAGLILGGGIGGSAGSYTASSDLPNGVTGDFASVGGTVFPIGPMRE
jgi:hypothetical protein